MGGNDPGVTSTPGPQRPSVLGSLGYASVIGSLGYNVVHIVAPIKV